MPSPSPLTGNRMQHYNRARLLPGSFVLSKHNHDNFRIGSFGIRRCCGRIGMDGNDQPARRSFGLTCGPCRVAGARGGLREPACAMPVRVLVARTVGKYAGMAAPDQDNTAPVRCAAGHDRGRTPIRCARGCCLAFVGRVAGLSGLGGAGSDRDAKKALKQRTSIGLPHGNDE